MKREQFEITYININRETRHVLDIQLCTQIIATNRRIKACTQIDMP